LLPEILADLTDNKLTAAEAFAQIEEQWPD
jgi:hypothetical protein